MKDSEFIELLNLYLDHEISPADAARLEAEVQSSPERRKVYLQYCRMQKACSVLAKDFAEQAATAEAEGRRVVAFEPARPAWSAGLWAVGGLAAAACVALVLVNRTRETSHSAAEVAVAQSNVTESKVIVAQGGLSLAANSNASIGHTVTVPVAQRVELKPVLVSRGLTLATQSTTEEVVAETTKLDWIADLRIAPVQRVQVEDLRFENRAVSPAKSPVFGGQRRPEQGVVELTAFQFQK